MRIKLSFFITILSISACTNWKEEPAIARVILVNALPGADQVEFRHNGQLLQNQPFKYGEDSKGYLNLQAGRKNFSVNQSGQTTPFLDSILFLTDYKTYSAFLTKNIILIPAKDTLIFYPDTLTKPAVGKARVRFVNLYPEDTSTTKLDLLYKTQITALGTLFSKRAFMNISPFVTVDASSTYTFKVTKNGKMVSNDSLYIPLNEEISYTIFATDSGELSDQGEKTIRLQLIEHK